MRKSTKVDVIIVDDPIIESDLSKSELAEQRSKAMGQMGKRFDEPRPVVFHTGDLYHLGMTKSAFPPHDVANESLPCRCYVRSGMVHGPMDSHTDEVCRVMIGVSTPFWEFSPKDVLFDRDKPQKATVLGNPSFARGDVFKCGEQVFMVEDFEFIVSPPMCRLKLVGLPRERW